MTDTMTETVPTAFVVGRRYRVNIDNPEGVEVRTGTTVECVRLGTAPRFAVIGENDTPEGREWIIYRTHLDDLPRVGAEAFEPVMVTQEAHDAALAERDATITRLRADVTRLNAWQGSAQTDAETISNNLNDEAVRRDWCGDYDEIVGRINSRLTVLHLEERNVDYDVTWQETYEVTITRTATFEGIRGDSDGNSERAEDVRDNSESLNEYDLIQHLRDNGNHSFTEYVDDSLEWDES
ncbi:MAG: hypothetical protein ACOYB3_01925 [Azonexus sp.]